MCLVWTNIKETASPHIRGEAIVLFKGCREGESRIYGGYFADISALDELNYSRKSRMPPEPERFDQ
jgi:hypothetical protein